MAVQRFRSVDEMNEAPLWRPGPGSFDRFLRHCARYWSIFPRIYPRGVVKFRTLEAAQRARQAHLRGHDA